MSERYRPQEKMSPVEEPDKQEVQETDADTSQAETGDESLDTADDFEKKADAVAANTQLSPGERKEQLETLRESLRSRQQELEAGNVDGQSTQQEGDGNGGSDQETLRLRRLSRKLRDDISLLRNQETKETVEAAPAATPEVSTLEAATSPEGVRNNLLASAGSLEALRKEAEARINKRMDPFMDREVYAKFGQSVEQLKALSAREGVATAEEIALALSPAYEGLAAIRPRSDGQINDTADSLKALEGTMVTFMRSTELLRYAHLDDQQYGDRIARLHAGTDKTRKFFSDRRIALERYVAL